MYKNFRITVASFIVTVVMITAGCGGGGGGGGASVNTPPPPPPVPPPTGSLGDAGLDAMVEFVRLKNELPAMAAIVVLQGQIAESAASGRRSASRNQPVAIGDKWHLGSLTKSMTGTLTGVLVEQSLMSWEMTPLDVWPQLAATIQDQYRTVTVAQLLSHQSGLPTDVAAIPSFQAVVDAAPGSVMEKRFLWASELLALAPETGTGDFLYTNAGYIVVGAMMETLTGSRWEDLMSDNIFGPLGMHDSGFGAPGTTGQVDEPWGHRFQNGGLIPFPPGPGADNPASLGPAGTVHGTLQDYALYMLSHINGERGVPGIVTTETFRFLHSPAGDWPYGMGWQIETPDEDTGGAVLQHSGRNDRWFAQVALAPGLDIGLLIVTNVGGVAANEAIGELGDMMLERIRASL